MGQQYGTLSKNGVSKQPHFHQSLPFLTFQLSFTVKRSAITMSRIFGVVWSSLDPFLCYHGVVNCSIFHTPILVLVV